MNKRHLHHIWTKFRAIKPIYFLIITVVAGTICVVVLRANNQHMVKLRDDVYTADKSGKELDAALSNLRNYVYAHMNTDLASGPNAVYPPIQLKYTYDRLVSVESARVAAINAQVYPAAQAYCEQQDPTDFSGHNRVPCIESYVNAHGAQAQTIPDDLYKFNFVSPNWSPDLAGWSLVAAIFFGLLTVITFILDRWFRHEFKTKDTVQAG